MLTQNYNTENFKNTYMEIKNVSKNLVDWLENLAVEYRCKIERKEWRSKYNHYIAYDYEPFCSEGFEINLTISSRDTNFLNFINYLYELRVRTANYLECCYLM